MTMKKIFIAALVALMAVSCNNGENKNTVDKGAENACQFVKEQIPELREDIASIEVIDVDTLLCDEMLSFTQIEFAKTITDFLNDSISKKEFKEIIELRELVMKDIGNSWEFGIVVNDSLRRLEKYDGCWRKVYKVKVTTKSGTTREPRVLMDRDGETPRMLEMKFGKLFNEYGDEIDRASEYLRMY